MGGGLSGLELGPGLAWCTSHTWACPWRLVLETLDSSHPLTVIQVTLVKVVSRKFPALPSCSHFVYCHHSHEQRWPVVVLQCFKKLVVGI